MLLMYEYDALTSYNCSLEEDLQLGEAKMTSFRSHQHDAAPPEPSRTTLANTSAPTQTQNMRFQDPETRYRTPAPTLRRPADPQVPGTFED